MCDVVGIRHDKCEGEPTCVQVHGGHQRARWPWTSSVMEIQNSANGKDHLHKITLSSIGVRPRKVTKVSPLIHGDATTYGSGLDSCFKAQPVTSPLHEGPPSIDRFTRADQWNQ
jgi:hypothetical protein